MNGPACPACGHDWHGLHCTADRWLTGANSPGTCACRTSIPTETETPMSDLTPESARAAAAWLEARSDKGDFEEAGIAFLREADRLEAAAKTPGQVAEYAFRCAQSSGHASTAKCFEAAAAAVIDHHVGPDRVVVDRVDVAYVTGGAFDLAQRGGAEGRLREALS